MKRYFIFFIFLFTCSLSRSQSENTSDAAFKNYVAISDTMAVSFPEDEMRTFIRNSFSEEQLQTYLYQHTKRMDLLAKIHGHYSFKLQSYLHSGNWYNKIGFPQKSIEAYNDFFKYYKLYERYLTEGERQSFIEMQAYAHSILAENYAKLSDFKNAEREHRENIRFSKHYKKIFNPSSLNNFGLYFYQNTKKIDSALIYFNKAFAITQTYFPKHTLNGSIRDNIADVYREQGSYSKAEPLYRTNFEFYKTAINEKTNERDIPRLVLAGTQLVQTQIQLNELKGAKTIFKELTAIVKDSSIAPKITIFLKLAYLRAKAALLKSQHNFEAAFITANTIQFYSDSLNALEDSNDLRWRNALNNIILDKVSFNFRMERIQKENQIAAETQKFWIVLLISIAALTILISLFFRRRQYLVLARNKQLLAEQQLENTKLKVEQLNTEILIKERDLSDFAVNLSQNWDWARSLDEKLQQIRAANPSDLKELVDDLEADIQKKITFDGYSQEFLERLDELGAAFYGQLQERYPNLTKNEIRLCSLIRLKLDNGSIADIQNITLASLHTSRYRLRKKLDLQGDSDLNEFIIKL